MKTPPDISLRWTDHLQLGPKRKKKAGWQLKTPKKWRHPDIGILSFLWFVDISTKMKKTNLVQCDWTQEEFCPGRSPENFSENGALSRRPNLAWTFGIFSQSIWLWEKPWKSTTLLKTMGLPFLMILVNPYQKWRFLKFKIWLKKRWLSNHPGSTHDHAMIIAPLKLVQLEGDRCSFFAKLGISSEI